MLNWIAADFFVKTLGNVLMLKNGTGTEKRWGLLRDFMGPSSFLEFQAFWTSLYLKSCFLSLGYVRLIFMRVCIFVIQAWSATDKLIP